MRKSRTNFNVGSKKLQKAGRKAIPVKVRDNFPSQPCQVYLGAKEGAKTVISLYKHRFGTFPKVAYFCKGSQWWLPLPEESGQ